MFITYVSNICVAQKKRYPIYVHIFRYCLLPYSCLVRTSKCMQIQNPVIILKLVFHVKGNLELITCFDQLMCERNKKSVFCFEILKKKILFTWMVRYWLLWSLFLRQNLHNEKSYNHNRCNINSLMCWLHILHGIV